MISITPDGPTSANEWAADPQRKCVGSGHLAGVPVSVTAQPGNGLQGLPPSLKHALSDAAAESPLPHMRPLGVTAGQSPHQRNVREWAERSHRHSGMEDGPAPSPALLFIERKIFENASRSWQEDGKDASRKRKRRPGYPRKRTFIFGQRSKYQPAAADDRYERVFPLRDQSNQLYVHPELADTMDRTRVDPDFALLAVSIDKDHAAMIRRDIAMGLYPGKLASAQGLAEQEREVVSERYDKLIFNLRSALENVMKGEEPIPPGEVYVRVLAEDDLDPGEMVLKGQYGLFNRKNAEGKWRSITEGEHLCFFSGFYCQAADEYEAECKRYPREEIDAYALIIGNDEYPCICPFQGGNLGQFANSALKKDSLGNLVEDKSRTNTRFARADITFEDNRPGNYGRHIVFYPVIFLYMLATPEHDGMFEREARVRYGQQYWEGFTGVVEQ